MTPAAKVCLRLKRRGAPDWIAFALYNALTTIYLGYWKAVAFCKVRMRV